LAPIGSAQQKARSSSLERLQVGDEHVVRHDRAGAEHLGAADGDARLILVDHARHQVVVLVAPVLGAVGLRVDDHVGQEQIAAAGIVEVAGERLGARLVVAREHVEPDALADQRRGEVIR
jgi:hypothetical protein